MMRFSSILLPLDGSPEAARGAGCALWLAHGLDATLHVLHASAQAPEGRDALASLHVPGVPQSRVVLHQLAAHADAAVLDAIALHDVGLVVMSARGESAAGGLKPKQRLGTVAQSVIERSPVPVLLLPVRYREALPWSSIMVAASDEAAADRALETATQLAAALQLKVTVAQAANGTGAAPVPLHGGYADAAHHEFPGRVDQMVERGLAGCTSDECRSIERVLVLQGDPATVLLELAASRRISALALGWHGRLGPGHARVFKRLLEEAECPLLLVRSSEASTARLKVGEEIGD